MSHSGVCSAGIVAGQRLQVGHTALEEGGQQCNPETGLRHRQRVGKAVDAQHHVIGRHFGCEPAIELEVARVPLEADPALFPGQFLDRAQDLRASPFAPVDLEREIGEFAADQPIRYRVRHADCDIGLAPAQARMFARGRELDPDFGKG